MTEDYFDFDLYDIPEEELGLNSDEFVSDNVMVLYREDYEQQTELFQKIFQAVGLDLEKDLVLLKLEKGQQVNLSRFLSSATKQIVSFGISQTKLGINAKFRAYHSYQTESYAILLSHSLKKLSESKEHKKALWGALKNIYKS